MTTFSIHRSLCGIAMLAAVLTSVTVAMGCETLPASDAPKAQVVKRTIPPVSHPHTAGRDFDTVY
jgi:hypothetical protein